jgi:hypothetical protein
MVLIFAFAFVSSFMPVFWLVGKERRAMLFWRVVRFYYFRGRLRSLLEYSVTFSPARLAFVALSNNVLVL